MQLFFARLQVGGAVHIGALIPRELKFNVIGYIDAEPSADTRPRHEHASKQRRPLESKHSSYTRMFGLRLYA